MLATGSMDNTSRLWDVETGECLHTLLGHTAEIVSLDFDTQGNRIITGSFDNSVKVWDVRTGRCIHTLTGHQGEISSCQFNYASDLCISGSIDRTCKVLILTISMIQATLCAAYLTFFWICSSYCRCGTWQAARACTPCAATTTKSSTSPSTPQVLHCALLFQNTALNKHASTLPYK